MNGWTKTVLAGVAVFLITASISLSIRTWAQVGHNTEVVAEVKKKCESMPERLARIEANTENMAKNMEAMAKAIESLNKQMQHHVGRDR